MITRKRARERTSLPEKKGFAYTLGLFADKIYQALVSHVKMSDDIPELPDFTEFVSTNFINRSLSYPLVHLGDRWSIWTKVPTAYSAVAVATQSIPTGVETVIITHSGLGIFRYFEFTMATMSFTIIIKVDGTEILRILFTDLYDYNVSDFYNGLIRVARYDGISTLFSIICDKKLYFRNLFQVSILQSTGVAVNCTKIKSMAEMHSVSW